MGLFASLSADTTNFRMVWLLINVIFKLHLTGASKAVLREIDNVVSENPRVSLSHLDQ